MMEETINYTEYIMVYETLKDLEKEVSKKLKDGWFLYGNPFTKSNYFAQAMVKKTKKEKTIV